MAQSMSPAQGSVLHGDLGVTAGGQRSGQGASEGTGSEWLGRGTNKASDQRVEEGGLDPIKLPAGSAWKRLPGRNSCSTLRGPIQLWEPGSREAQSWGGSKERGLFVHTHSPPHTVLHSRCLGHGWGGTGLGESLSRSGTFCLKSLVPAVLPNTGSRGRWGVVKGQGAGDKDQGTGVAGSLQTRL